MRRIPQLEENPRLAIIGHNRSLAQIKSDRASAAEVSAVKETKHVHGGTRPPAPLGLPYNLEVTPQPSFRSIPIIKARTRDYACHWCLEANFVKKDEG
jgi:hypothetical protein